MRTYEVTFERNGVYQSNLAVAENDLNVKNWFNENKKSTRVIAIKEATSDSMKPGKPCITIQ